MARTPIKVCATADATVCPIDVPALDIAAGTHYTIAATNALATIEAQVLVDDPSPTVGKAQARVVHFSADTPAVDVLTQDKSAKVVENLAYPDATDYLTLDPGSYDLIVCANADNTVCPLDPGALDLAGGTSYSVFAIGSLTGDSLTAAVGVDGVAAPAAPADRPGHRHGRPDRVDPVEPAHRSPCWPPSADWPSSPPAPGSCGASARTSRRASRAIPWADPADPPGRVCFLHYRSSVMPSTSGAGSGPPDRSTIAVHRRRRSSRDSRVIGTRSNGRRRRSSQSEPPGCVQPATGRQPDERVGALGRGPQDRAHDLRERRQGLGHTGRIRPARVHRVEADRRPRRRDHSRMSDTWARFARA